MTKKRKILILLIVVAIVALSIFSISKTQPKTTVSLVTSQKTIEKEDTEKVVQNAFLKIENKEYSAEIVNGESVYDFMNKLKSEGKINFKDKTYIGMGKFIEEINGVKSNGDKYWIYYVNGEKAKIGVSDYKIKRGDIVSWKYEKEVY